MTFKEDDAGHEPVGMVHLLDRFRAFLLRQLGVAPVFQQPEMHPVLIDRSKFQK
jgi:hypothetical protein